MTATAHPGPFPTDRARRCCTPRSTSRSSLPRLAAGFSIAGLALVAFLAIPTASAHGVPPPKDQSWTRVLSDFSDDCGAHGVTDQCSGSDDLIALDVKEAHDDSMGDIVTFRFWLDKGASGTNKDTLKLSSPAGGLSLDMQTTDGSHYAGSFDQVGDAASIGDGSRFTVDASVKAGRVGGASGTLSGFSIQAFHGSTAGDKMPGTYVAKLGGDGPQPPNDASCGCPYKRDYTLRGTGYYVTAKATPSPLSVPAGHEALVSLDVKNAFNDVGQKITVHVDGASGVQARFHATNGNGYADSEDVDLAAGQPTIIHLAVQGNDAGSHGTLTVTIDTDQGGRTKLDVPYSVGAPDSVGNASPLPTTTGGGKKAPGLAGAAPMAALAATAALVLASRRRA